MLSQHVELQHASLRSHLYVLHSSFKTLVRSLRKECCQKAIIGFSVTGKAKILMQSKKENAQSLKTSSPSAFKNISQHALGTKNLN
jgi:hypothetical protein